MPRAYLAAALSFALCGASVTAVLAQQTTPTPSVECAQPNAPAHVVHAVEADTPAVAAHFGIGGRVVVRVTVTGDGRVTSAAIASSTSNVFNRSALEAARGTTYAGEIRGCVPITAAYGFVVDYAAPYPLPPTRVDVAKYFPGTWHCTAASGETRTLTILHDGNGIDVNDGSVTTTAIQDEYRVWRIRRAGTIVGWAYPWVDDAWEWGSHGANDHALRYRRIDEGTFTLTTTAGSGLGVIEKNERCARLKPAP